MEFVTAIADPSATSYATLEEFTAYLTERDGFDLTSWNALTDAQKALRAFYGTAIIDSLVFRGCKATKSQALQFPRIMPDSPLYSSGKPFTDWESLEDFAALLDVTTLPVIPQAVKTAQIEATFQIVHSHLMDIGAFETGEADIASLSIDAISMSFRNGSNAAYDLFSKSDFGSVSTIKLLLQPYLAVLRGALV